MKKLFFFIFLPFFVNRIICMDPPNIPRKKQKKEEEIVTKLELSLNFSNFIGEVPEQFKLFGLALKNRNQLNQKNIIVPESLLIAGPKDTGKTLLIKELAYLLNADSITKKKDEIPKEHTTIFCNSDFEKSINNDRKKLSFFHIELGNIPISIKALKNLKEKIREINNEKKVHAVLIIETRREPNSLLDYEDFANIVSLELPNTNQRKMLLHYFAQKIKMTFDKNLFDSIADKYNTPDFTPPQLEKLAHEASTRALFEKSEKVLANHFEEVLRNIKPLEEKKQNQSKIGSYIS